MAPKNMVGDSIRPVALKKTKTWFYGNGLL
jgi:hypothetical protein